MNTRDNTGSIPVGYIGIRELYERAVAAIHGPDAVAEITAVTTTADGEEIDPADGTSFIKPRVEITRAGRIISGKDDAEIWEKVQNSIVLELVAGRLEAFVERPDTGKEYRILADHWRAGVSSLAFQSGTYDCAPDRTLEGRCVFFKADAVELFLSTLRPHTETQATVDAPPRISEAEAKRLYSARVKSWPKDQVQPTQTDDVAWGSKLGISRARMRKYREEFAPQWRFEPGERKATKTQD